MTRLEDPNKKMTIERTLFSLRETVDRWINSPRFEKGKVQYALKKAGIINNRRVLRIEDRLPEIYVEDRRELFTLEHFITEANRLSEYFDVEISDLRSEFTVREMVQNLTNDICRSAMLSVEIDIEQ